MPVITEQAYECTPSSLLASTPCLACVSETQLLAALVGIFATAAEKEIPAVLKDSACFTCMTKKQMLQSLVTIAGNDLLGERYSAQDVLDSIRCIGQCSTEKQLLAALLYLLCNDFTLTTGEQT